MAQDPRPRPGRLVTVQMPDGPREIDIYTREGFDALSDLWTRSGWHNRVSYEVTWLGIPIIQVPEDMVMVQELIWKVRPDVIIECGVAHGGALILYASLLELMGRGRAIGIDVEIRKYNRLAIQSHPMSRRITLIEGSSVAEATAEQVRGLVQPTDVVMVMLDSNHTKEHVLAELELYGPLTTPDSYVIVFDEVMPMVADAPNGSPTWDQDNPLEAVRDYLARHPEFVSDPAYERLGVTYCRGGFLRRLRLAERDGAPPPALDVSAQVT